MNTTFLTGLRIREEQPLAVPPDGGTYRWKRVLWNGAPCAGKLMRPTGGAPDDKDTFFDLVGKACIKWSQLRHPYLLQLFGMYRSPAENLPVLVADLVDTDLSSLLRARDKGALPLGLKARLLEHILLGLAHLHSHTPPLVHGSLSASKVVVDTKRWVGKLTECCLREEGPTTVGGIVTLFHDKEEERAYQPPEAYNGVYTAEGDVFAYGVLILHAIGHSLPLPTPSTQQAEDAVEMFSEFEARKHCLAFFSYGELEQFQKIIQRCLRYSPEDRMDMKTLCAEIQSISKSIVQEDPFLLEPEQRQPLRHQQSTDVELLQIELENAVHRALSAEEQARKWQKEASQVKEAAEKVALASCIDKEKIVLLSAKLQSGTDDAGKVTELRTELRELLERVEELEKDKASLCAAKEELLGRLHKQDGHATDNNAPNTTTAVTASSLGQPSQLQKATDNNAPNTTTAVTASSLGQPSQLQKVSFAPSLKEGVRWTSGPDMPERLLAAAAVQVGGAIYVGGGAGEDSSPTRVYKLLLDTLQWLTLPRPQYPVMFFTLVGCRGLVHMLGGLYGPFNKPKGAKHVSGSVLTFDEQASSPWAERLPSLITPRHSANAVSIDSYIVIAGGELDEERLSSIEVIDTSVEHPSWYKVGVIPEPIHGPRMVVWQDKLVIGLGIVLEFFIRRLYTIPLSKLMKKDLPVTASTWVKLPDTPLKRSALAVVSGQLVTIGGTNTEKVPQTKCAVCDPRKKCWNEFSNVGLRRALPAAVSTDQGIFVIGGVFSVGHCLTKTTEIGLMQNHH